MLSWSDAGLACPGALRAEVERGFPEEIAGVVTRVNNEKAGGNFLFSTPLPVTVPAMSSNSALVLFEGQSKLLQNSATHLPVQVCTTRGRPLEMKWLLPEGWASRRNIDEF